MSKTLNRHQEKESSTHSHPPKKALHFLLRFMDQEERENFKEYTSSVYEEILITKSQKSARVWFWTQFIRSLPGLIGKSMEGSIFMFKSYLKSARRHFGNHKIHTLIKMAGLALGTACCMLIFLYVRTESNYDRYHENTDRIYRVGLIWKFPTGQNPWTTIAQPAVQILQEHTQDVESIARIRNYGTQLVRIEDKTFYEPYCLMADPEIFRILTIPSLTGNSEAALQRPNTVIITERMARKYFGHTNPLGKHVQIGSRELEITGVVKDPPRNTHCKYNFLISLSTAQPERKENWGNLSYITYLKLREGVQAKAFEEKIKHMADEKYDYLKESGTSHIYFLQPLKNIHLHSNLRRELESPGNPTELNVLAAVAVFVLMLTILNFVSLATAANASRFEEVGIRKVLGAQRSQLVFQFVLENGAIIAISMFAACALAFCALPVFNTLSSTRFEVADLFRIDILVVFFILSLVLLFGAALYPAFILTSIGPDRTIRGMTKKGQRRLPLRSMLVIGQFTISVGMIASTMIVSQQVHFMSHQYLGFEKKQKLIIPIRGGASIKNNYETVKAEFAKHATISGVCVSSDVPGRPSNVTGMRIQGSGSVYRFQYYNVDHDFIPMYGIKVLSGSNFQQQRVVDPQPIIINEAGLKKFGLNAPEEAIGKRVARSDFGPFTFEIIGVIRNMHVAGLQSEVEPFFLKMDPNYYYISLQIKTSGLEETIGFAHKKWSELFPGIPFEYFFLDEEFNRQYISEKRMASLFRFFSFLGLFIACLGLFSLMIYTVSQRTKEVAIRKIVGASVPIVTGLFLKQYLIWVLIANIISWPIAYYFMHEWLQDFAYRTGISIWIFVLAGLITTGIALLTVSYQSVKAATANPVDSLRYE